MSVLLLTDSSEKGTHAFYGHRLPTAVYSNRILSLLLLYQVLDLQDSKRISQEATAGRGVLIRGVIAVTAVIYIYILLRTYPYQVNTLGIGSSILSGIMPFCSIHFFFFQDFFSCCCIICLPPLSHHASLYTRYTLACFPKSIPSPSPFSPWFFSRISWTLSFFMYSYIVSSLFGFYLPHSPPCVRRSFTSQPPPMYAWLVDTSTWYGTSHDGVIFARTRRLQQGLLYPVFPPLPIISPLC